MENKTVYKPIIKEFLGQDVRIIKVDDYHEYVVCKDMFDVLGLVKENGSWASPKKKMLDFLNGINKSPDVQSLDVRLKDKQSKKGQVREVDCLNIETVPIVLTQFQPTKRRGEDALNRWFDFMKFVDMLLEYHEVHKYIVDDKEKQKLAIKEIVDNGGNAMITNRMVNKIMGKLITDDDDFSIKKDELKIYQPQTTIDLLEVRNFVMDKFSTFYAFTESHKESYNATLKLAQKKYLK